MRLASFRHRGRASFGLVAGDGLIDLAGLFAGEAAGLREILARDLLADVPRRVAQATPGIGLDEVDFLPPIPDAGVVIGIGRNYRDHAEEVGGKVEAAPRVFFKRMSALVGHGQPLVRPRLSECLDYEGELAVVIGRAGRYVDPADAASHIAGYTILNDGSVRDFQAVNILAGKNFPASGSVGPWLLTADELPDPKALTLVTRVNGEERQRGSTGDLIFDIPAIIAYVSRWTELLPGDIIATGTPAGVGSARRPPVWLKAGDRVEVEIAPIGTLCNVVIDEA